MEEIKYSIIIPHHNIPDLLQRCINSIPDSCGIQVIIVDDNSNPDIVDFANFPGKDRKNVEVIFSKESGGAGHARNVGLQFAKGKWLLFADADDFFVDDMLSILDNYYNSDADCICFNISSVYSNDLSKPGYRSKKKLFDEYKKERNIDIFRLRYTEPWGKMIKRQLINEYGIKFDETEIANDHYFSVHVGCVSKKIFAIDIPLYIVTVREGSLSYQLGDTREKLLIRIGVCIRVQRLMKKYGYVMRPMPLRSLMVILLKRYPRYFIMELFVLSFKTDISICKLLIQMLLPKYYGHNNIKVTQSYIK